MGERDRELFAGRLMSLLEAPSWLLGWQNPPLSRMCFCSGKAQGPSSPSGMMERYFPRNLLEMVISCQRLQPFLEDT